MVETLLQWMSTSPAARSNDRELGTLEQDLIEQTPLLSYLRYNIELDRDTLRNELQMDLSPEQVTSLSEMDDPRSMPMLKKIGELVGEKKVDGKHFPVAFELTT